VVLLCDTLVAGGHYGTTVVQTVVSVVPPWWYCCVTAVLLWCNCCDSGATWSLWCNCEINRSDVVPVLSKGNEAHASLLSDVNFHFDVVYVHRRLSDENKAQQIYDKLRSLSTGPPRSFHFETTSSMPKLKRCLATFV